MVDKIVVEKVFVVVVVIVVAVVVEESFVVRLVELSEERGG